MSSVSASVDELSREFSSRLAREDRARYVYTYPFKGAYRPTNSAPAALESWRRTSGPLNIYLHIPYCEMKCSFCNLFTTTQRHGETLGQYVDALLKEMRIFANRVGVSRFQVESVYFGGGTPILLSDELLTKVVGELREVFRFKNDAEMSIESSPNSIDVSRLSALLKLGFGRLSLGVQTFHESLLSAMGRPYEAQLGSTITLAALSAGLKNVNVDLIYGLPSQDERTWMEDLNTAVRLEVPTISIYPLTIRSRTRFGLQFEQAQTEFLAGTALYSFYDMAVDMLSSKGYRQITATAFAKDNGGNRHEVNEFCGTPTLGLGAAALSYAPDIHYTSVDYLDRRSTSVMIGEYLDAIRQDQLPIRSSILIDEDESRRRYIILRLLYSGLDLTEYRECFGESLLDRFSAEANVLRLEHCIEEDSAHMSLSKRGRRFSSLIADLFASENVKRLSASYK